MQRDGLHASEAPCLDGSPKVGEINEWGIWAPKTQPRHICHLRYLGDLLGDLLDYLVGYLLGDLLGGLLGDLLGDLLGEEIS